MKVEDVAKDWNMCKRSCKRIAEFAKCVVERNSRSSSSKKKRQDENREVCLFEIAGIVYIQSAPAKSTSIQQDIMTVQSTVYSTTCGVSTSNAWKYQILEKLLMDRNLLEKLVCLQFTHMDLDNTQKQTSSFAQNVRTYFLAKIYPL